MASRKRRRPQDTCAAAPETWTLPADLLLEIAGRSSLRVLIRFAATSKLLRRDFLAAFIRRVGHSRILAYLHGNKPPFILVHPATPAAASFCTSHLFPFFSRHAPGRYSVVTSRRGLILLERWCHRVSRPNSELCVYDPMSGAKAFLSCPPLNEIGSIVTGYKYTLLTAADGIRVDGSFMLLVADFNSRSIKLRTASSRRKWRLVMSNQDFPWFSVKRCCDPAILYGGIVHWLVSHGKPILSYDLGRRKLGSVNLPPTSCEVEQLHLATSCDGKLLKLLAIEGFTISVWLQLTISPTTGGSGWSLCTVIDMEEKLRSLRPDIPPNSPDEPIKFDDSQTRSGDVVFLSMIRPDYDESYYIVAIFDLETKDMYMQKHGSALLEIDLQSRVSTTTTDGPPLHNNQRPKRLRKPNRRVTAGADWTT